MQERDDAARMFPTEEAAAAHSAKTFEVDADFEAQTKALQQQQQQQEQQAAAEAQPAAAKKGPTPEQMIAVKAAIANAQVRCCLSVWILFVDGCCESRCLTYIGLLRDYGKLKAVLFGCYMFNRFVWVMIDILFLLSCGVYSRVVVCARRNCL